MKLYPKKNDKDAFRNISRINPLPPAEKGKVHECPRCHGHGCWRATVDIIALCPQCRQNGYVEPNYSGCCHRLKRNGEKYGANKWKCKFCDYYVLYYDLEASPHELRMYKNCRTLKIDLNKNKTGLL